MTPEFDSYAPQYDGLLRDPVRERFSSGSAFFHRRKALMIEDFFARQNISAANLAWLDVGCGQGELLKIAGRKFRRAAGCDPSAAMMKHCEGIELFEQPSPADLPFADQSFDFVTAVCVYHHVPGNQRAALTASIVRVLKPGGIFCMIEHNPLNPITQLIVRRCPVDVDARLLTSMTAERLTHFAGLKPIQTTYFLLLPERLFNHVGGFERHLRRLPFGGQFALFARRVALPCL